MACSSHTKSFAAALILAATLTGCATHSGWANMSGSFDGWHMAGDPNWRIENGEFVADGGNGHLVTDESFTDFHLTLEFFASDGAANSGVYFRIQNPQEIRDNTSYEVNVWDDRPDQSGRTGGIPNYGAPLEVVSAGGKWNTFDIRAEGDHIVVLTNGIKTIDIRDSTHDSGPISLQYAAGVIKYRNIQLKRL
jgi:hypothetical protein